MIPGVVEADARDFRRARVLSNFLIVAIALLVVKLALISGREILPERDDSIGYVRFSLDNLSSVLTGEGSHPPGPSLVMALGRFLGIPYRTFLEILFAASAFSFLRPLAASA